MATLEGRAGTFLHLDVMKRRLMETNTMCARRRQREGDDLDRHLMTAVPKNWEISGKGVGSISLVRVKMGPVGYFKLETFDWGLSGFGAAQPLPQLDRLVPG